MRTSELDYELPPGADRAASAGAPGRVAAARLRPRDRRRSRHRRFRDLRSSSRRRTLVVVNDTRVVPARITVDASGGAARCCCSSGVEGGVWEALARPTRRLRAGMELRRRRAPGARSARAAGALRLYGEPDGETPLPPYITEPLADPERYQTVYARREGSAAAPTAGLHFTPELLARLDVERVTLHVGLDTFRPLTAETLAEHRAAQRALRGRGRRRGSGSAAAERVLAVGTTTDARAGVARPRRAARGAHRPLHHAGLRVPARRLAADELPPAALDAARARDGVRRRGGDARGCTGSRSRSAIASTRSATRC